MAESNSTRPDVVVPFDIALRAERALIGLARWVELSSLQPLPPVPRALATEARRVATHLNTALQLRSGGR